MKIIHTQNTKSKTTVKSLLALFFFASSVLTSFSQNSVEHWSSFMIFGGTARASTIVHDENSEFLYIAGLFTADIEFPITNPPIQDVLFNYNGQDDAFIAKIDESTGEFIWFINFGSDEDDEIVDLAIGPDGNIYFTGFFEQDMTLTGYDGVSYDVNSIDDGDLDIFIGSIRSDGNFNWAIAEGGDNEDVGFGITATDDGIAVIAMFNQGANSSGSNGVVRFQGNSNLAKTIGRSDIVILKYDFNGNPEWYVTGGSQRGDAYPDNSPGGPGSQTRQTKMNIDYYNDSLFIIGSFVDGDSQDFKLYDDSDNYISGSSLNSADTDLDIFITSFHKNGTFNWIRDIKQSGGHSYGYGIAVDCQGVYVCAHADKDIYINQRIGGNSIIDLPGGHEETYFVTKLDKSDGISEWIYILEPFIEDGSTNQAHDKENVAMTIDSDDNGSLYFGGMREYQDTDELDAFVSKINAQTGVLQGTKTFGNSEDDYLFDLSSDANGNVYLAGVIQGASDLVPIIKKITFDNFVEHQQYCDPITSVTPGEIVTSNISPCFGETVTIALPPVYGNVTQWEFYNGSAWILLDNTGSNFLTVVNQVQVPITIRVIAATGTYYINYTPVPLPSITCPSDQTVSTEADCSTYILEDYISTFVIEDCYTLVQDPLQGSVLTIGTTSVSINVIDLEGTSHTLCNFDISVQNTIICPTDTIFIQKTFPTCTALVGDYRQLVVDLSCNYTEADLEQNLINTPFGDTQIVTIREIDDQSNNCNVVLQSVNPITLFNANPQFGYLDSNCNYLMEDFTGSLQIIGCGVYTVSQTPAVGTGLGAGVSSLTFQITEVGSPVLPTIYSVNLTVIDTISPVFVNCATEPVVTDCEFIIPDYTTLVSMASDNCTANLTYTQSHTAGDIIPRDQNTTYITIEATDESGNSSICIIPITFQVDPPTAICQDITVILDQFGNATISTNDIDNGSIDDCDNPPLLALSQTNFNETHIGDNVIVLAVTNTLGLSSTCSSTVTIIAATDTDGDGVIDEFDLDSDNDGIPDTEECIPVASGISGSLPSSDFDFHITGSTTNINTWKGLDSLTIFGEVYSYFTWPSEYSGNFTNGADLTDIYIIKNGVVLFDANDVDWDEKALIPFKRRNLNYYHSYDTYSDGSNQYYELSYDSPIQINQTIFLGFLERNGNNAVVIQAFDENDIALNSGITVEVSDYIDPGYDIATSGGSSQSASIALYGLDALGAPGDFISKIKVTYVVASGDGADGKVFIIGQRNLLTCDTDNDGVINSLDLDSDNDGIYDLVENNLTSYDIDNDGMVDGSLGSNGLLNALETSLDSGTLINPITDSDADGVYDPYELDADNDGCFDVEEAEYSDTDFNGLLGTGTFGSGLTVDNSGLVTSALDGYTDPADDNSNLVYDFQEITLQTWSCGADITVTAPIGSCNASIVVTPPTISYCGAYTLTNDYNGTSDASGNYSGITNVVWTLVVPGVTLTCTQVINVLDNESPFFNCPTDNTIECNSIIPDYNSIISVSDNCDTGINIIQTPGIGSTITGNTTVTLSATDASGNTSSCSFILSTEDTTPPGVTACPAVPSINTCSYTVPDFTASIIASDNCSSNLTITQDVSVGTIIQRLLTPTVITITIDDGVGNISTCSVSINFNINPPVAFCQNITVNLDILGNISILSTDINDGSSDVCSNVTLSLSQYDFTTSDLGANIVDLIVTNDIGLSNTCSAVVTVLGYGVNNTLYCNVPDTTFDNDILLCGANLVLPQPEYNIPCLGNTAIQFDGNDDYISIPDVIPNGDFSIEFWFKPPSSNWTGTLFDMSQLVTGTSSPSNKYFFIYADDSKIRWNFEDENDTDIGNYNVPYDFSEVKWYHVVATGGFNSTSPHKLFIDGVVESTDNLNTSSKASEFNTPSLGNYGTLNNNVPIESFGGQMDNFRIYDIKLSTSEVNEVKNNDLSNVSSNVLLHYNFENGAGTLVSDKTTFGNHGSLENMDAVNSWVLSDLPASQITMTNDYNTTDNASDWYDVGTTTVTWNIDSECGDGITCSQEITVIDSENPIISCQDIDVYLSESGTASITLEDIKTGASDNCSIFTTSINTTSFDCSEIGVNTVTLTIDDGLNTNYCTAIVTVIDNLLPTITCPLDVIANVDVGSCSTSLGNISLGSPIVADNCSVSFNNNAPLSFPVGNTIVTWYAFDGNGNTDSCYQTVTIIDNIDPIITFCPGDMTVNADIGLCTASAFSFGSALGTDNCSYTINHDALEQMPVGVNIVTWTITDGHGNTDTCEQNITVKDDQNPVANCQADITVSLDGNGTVTILPSDVNNNSTDNCGIVSMSLDVDTFTSPQQFWVTLTVTDGEGNTDSCGSLVTIEDNNAPVAECQDITIHLDNVGSYTIDPTELDDGSTDNGTSLSFNSTTIFDCSDLGNNNVTLTVTDDSGNSSTCIAIVTVLDSITPTLNVQSPINHYLLNYQCDASFSDIDLGISDTLDNCLDGIIVTNNAPNILPLGATTFTWYIEDASGNNDSTFQTINVIDTLSPIIACPGDISQSAAISQCSAIIANLGNLLTTDVCLGTTIENNSTPSSEYLVGETIITWTVTDVSGNASTCDQTVTVIDNINPTITCPGDQTVDVDSNCEFELQDYTTLGVVSDNCTVISVTQSPAIGTIINGTTEITLTVTDEAGLNNMCTFDIILEDNLNPHIPDCIADFTAELDANCNYEIEDYTGLIIATDNCDTDLLITQSPLPGTIISGDGTIHTVTITATDDEFNDVQCTFNITLEDNTAPTIDCGIDMIQSADVDSCSAQVIIIPPTANDNCGITSLINDYNGTIDASDQYPVGITQIIWTATDTKGLQSTCSQIVTITDNQNPTLTCEADITVDADPTMCGAAITVNTPTTSDNCGILNITNNLNGSSTTPSTYFVGTTTLTWTATDIHGNTNSCSQNITVIDNTLPELTCPNDIEVNVDENLCGAQITVDIPTNSDACGVLSILNNFNGTDNATDFYPIDTTLVIWTLIDNNNLSTSCVQTIIVVDNQLPTINCPINILQSATAGACSSSILVGTPTTDDNCGIFSLINDQTLTSNADGNYNVGTTDIIWTVEDIHGNDNTCVQQIIVTDSENPALTCGTDIEAYSNADSCNVYLTIDIPVSSDNCGIDTLFNNFNNTNNASGIYSIGETVINWTSIDIHGNDSTCTQSITVIDTINPTIICPPNIEVDVMNNMCSVNNLNLGDPIEASDNCGINTIDDNGLNIYNIGTTIVTWTATDNSSNEASCQQEITVLDLILPTITCGNNISISTDDGVCSAYQEVVIPIVSDNCIVEDPTHDINNAPDVTDLDYDFPIGQTIITWTVEDVYGNSASCIQTIEVYDGEKPTIICPNDQDVIVNDNCEFTLLDYTTMATVNDNCDPNVVVTQSPIAGELLSGNQLISLIATDNNNNADTCTFNLIVIDNTNPIITNCPTGITEQIDGNCEFEIVDYTAIIQIEDNCDTELTITQSPGIGTIISDHGTIQTITITVEDDNNNSSTCSFDITLEDAINPTITQCYSDITENLDVNCEFELIDYTNFILANDNCSNFSDLTITQSPVSGTIISGDGAEETVQITVTDAAGNASTCSFLITLQDITPPVFTGEDSIVSIECNETPVIEIPSATDSCSANVTIVYTSETLEGTCPILETILHTWTATDDAGNISTRTLTVNYQDTTAPVFDISNDEITVDCGSTPAIPNPIATDLCDENVSVAYTTETLSQSCAGTYTVKHNWLATDACGNESSVYYIINFEDNEAPIFTEENYEADAQCGTITALPIFEANDNCGTVEIISELETIDGECANSYTEIFTYTAIDDCGNTSTRTATINYTDTQAPIFVEVNGDITIECDNTTYEVEEPTANDNCDALVDITYQSQTIQEIGDCSNFDVIHTWTATDNCGNFSQREFTVHYVDTTSPEFTNPPAETMNVTTSSIPAQEILVATDNCNTITYSTTEEITETTAGCPTSIIRTWTATDACGNETTVEQILTVMDDEAPEIFCNDSITVSLAVGATITTISWGQLLDSITDNCNDQFNFNFSQYSETGIYNNVITATDALGNESVSCSVVVTVVNEGPTANCLEEIVLYLDESGEGVLQAIDLDDGSVGGSDIDEITYHFNSIGTESMSYDCSNAGDTISASLIVVNLANVSHTCLTSTDVIVIDNIAPVIECQNDTIYMTPTGVNVEPSDLIESIEEACENTIRWNLGEDWNSEMQTINCDDGFNIPVELYVIDVSGNESEHCVANFVVIDELTLICANDTIVDNLLDSCGAFVTLNLPQILANCIDDPNDYFLTNSISTENDFSNTDYFSVGESIVTWSVNYGNNEPATCNQSITILDVQAPREIEGTCPLDTTYYLQNGECEKHITLTELQLFENCEGIQGATVSPNSYDLVNFDYGDALNGSGVFQVGETIIYYSASDLNGNGYLSFGNPDACQTTVTIVDNYNIEVVCPNDTTLYLTEECDIEYGLTPISVYDNCRVDLVFNDFEVNDSLFLVDSEANAALIAENIDLITENNQYDIDTDNLSTYTDVLSVGDTTITWYAWNTAGELSSCQQQVTVIDELAPWFSAFPEEAQTLDYNAGDIVTNFTIQLEDFIPIDNCLLDSIIVNYNGFYDPSNHIDDDSLIVEVPIFDNNQITITLIDIYGNDSIFYINFDGQLPAATCPEDTIFLYSSQDICNPLIYVDITDFLVYNEDENYYQSNDYTFYIQDDAVLGGIDGITQTIDYDNLTITIDVPLTINEDLVCVTNFAYIDEIPPVFNTNLSDLIICGDSTYYPFTLSGITDNCITDTTLFTVDIKELTGSGFEFIGTMEEANHEFFRSSPLDSYTYEIIIIDGSGNESEPEEVNVKVLSQLEHRVDLDYYSQGDVYPELHLISSQELFGDLYIKEQDELFNDSITHTELIYTTEWRIIEGEGDFDDETELETIVKNLSIGNITLDLTVSDGVCTPYSVETSFFVNPLLIPSGFSPNGDNINDVFEIKGLDQWKGSSLKIFNRWGAEEYSNNNYDLDNNWDGTNSRNKLLIDDTYFYVITISGIDYNGYVVIKRD